jgi:hypothetical protein
MRSSFVIAQSVRIIGHVRSNGRTGTLDLSLFKSGDMKGIIKSDGLSVAVLRVGGRTYLYLSKATFRFYRRSHHIPATACAVACGKYILVPRRFFDAFSLNSLSRLIDNSAPKAIKRAHKTGKKGRTGKKSKTGKEAPVPHVNSASFEGQPAWELTEGKFTIFIAKQSGYLLGMSKSKLGAVRFSEWNAVPAIKAPRPNQVFVFG